MERAQIVYDTLKQLDIAYSIVEHPPATSTEEADHYIEGKEGVRTKSLFLTNKKKTAFYLIIMDDQKRLDIKRLSSILDEKRLKFGSSELLLEKMNQSPGLVSPFGLWNNTEQDVQVYLDREMLAEKVVTFHPDDNTKTIFFLTTDLYKLLDALGYPYTIIDL